MIISWLTAYQVRGLYLHQTKEKLLSVARIVDQHTTIGFNKENLPELDSVCKNFGERSFSRITIIGLDGVVLGDTEEGPERMENHGDRPEVIEALAGGVGVSMRQSPTLKKQMMYLAIPHSPAGTITGVIRISLPLVELKDQLRPVYTLSLIHI